MVLAKKAKTQELKFSRREYKYIVPDYLLNELLIYFSRKCRPCEFNLYGKPYTVYSIYFDSPNRDFYREKIEGYADRKKVRFRFYNDQNADSTIFLEIKSKLWDKIYKERVVTPKDYMNVFISDTAEFSNTIAREAVACKVAYLKNVYGLIPTVAVKYDRTTFIDDVTRFKVSLDVNIRAAPPTHIFQRSSFQPVLSNHLIMELKVDELLPGYTIDLIKKYNLIEESISKYCKSLECLYSSS